MTGKQVETAEELFRYLQKSRTVCSNCFQLVTEEVKPVTWSKISSDEFRVRHPQHVKTTEIEYPVNDRKERAPDGRARGPCQCGATSPTVQVRPLNLYTAMERADNLCQTLSELGIRFDRGMLLRVVYHKKKDSQETGKDDSNFKEAIEAAVEISSVSGRALGVKLHS